MPDHYGGKELYNLESFVFRNHSLYRYEKKLVLLDEKNYNFDENNNIEILAAFEKNEMIYMRAKKFHEEEEEEEMKVKCEATCECWMSNDDDYNYERRNGIIFFSRKFISVVLVSVLGYASAKFVGNHLEDCYRLAKEESKLEIDDVEYHDEELVDETEGGLLNPREGAFECAFHPMECWEETGGEELKEHKLYECEGHCMTKNLKNPLAKKEAEELVCQDLEWGKEVIYITKEPNDMSLNKAAVERYRTLYLTAWCKSFQSIYEIPAPDGAEGSEKKVFFRPCVAKKNVKGYNNVKCKRLAGE